MNCNASKKMKVIIFIFALLLGMQASVAQYFDFDATAIPVYDKPYAAYISKDIPIDTIKQYLPVDSKDSDNEIWYDFNIIDTSALRFKIRYHIDSDCMSYYNLFKKSLIDEESWRNPPVKEGWVDKKYVHVRLKGRHIVEGDTPYFKLYKNINDPKPEYRFIVPNGHDEEIPLPVLEIGEGRWLKVMFYNHDKYYEGWTEDYCDNFFSTCS